MADQQQLDIETQINKAIQARAALLQNQKTLIADQIALAQELCRAMECQELDGYNERIKETREGLLAASDATQELDDSNQNMEKNLRKSSKTMDFFKGAAIGAAVGIKNIFGKVFGLLKNITSLVGGALMSGFKIVKFAIGGWSKMLGNLAQKGMEAANAGIGLRNAYENVRHEFGGLASKEGSAVTGAFDQMRSSMGNVAGTGIRFQKIFGRGPDGLAAGLEYMTGIAEEMGPKFEKMSEGFVDAADEILVLGRSLGFTGEEFAAMGTIAGYTGETMKESLGRLQREIVSVSKAMGVNTKATADNMKIMLKNPAVFGTNTKEMLKTSVAASKLGMSIEDLQSTMGVFDDFPSAAQAAADLAAEFGVVVDATDMMTAEPAEQMMMLKDAANAAGIEFDNMSRQERKRLAELTGVDANKMFELLDPSNAFDKNAQEEMSDGVDAATQATLSQSEATKELAKSMKRLHESMDAMNTQGGFFGTFIHGLQKGMMQSKEGREMLRNITNAFKIVHEAGREVGHMLMELFRPGGPMYFMYEYFSNLETRMRTAMPKVKQAFREFVDDLMLGGEDAQNAFSNLLGKLKDIFLGDIGGGETGKALLAGFHALGDLILTNIIKLVPHILTGLTKAFKMAIKLMSGEAPTIGVDLGENAILPMTQKAFADLMDSGVVQEFGKTFMEMMRKFWDEYGDGITDFFGGVLKAIIVAAIAQALGPIVIGGVLKMALGGLGGLIRGLMPGGAGGADPSQSMGLGEKIHEFAIGFAESVKEIAKIGAEDALRAGVVLAILGGTFALGVIGLGYLAKQLSSMEVDPMMMGIAAGVMVAIAYAAKAAGELVEVMATVPDDKKAWAKAALMMGAVTLVFGAVMYFTTEAVKSLQGVTFDESIGKILTAAGGLAMTGLIVTAGIVVMGGILGVIAALSAGPQIGILLAAIGAASLIFMGIMSFITNTVSDLAQFNAEEATAAMTMAEAAGVLMDTVLKVLDAVWGIMKGITWDAAVFDEVLGKMADVVTSIKDKFMPQALAAAELVTGNPAEIKLKLSIVTDTIMAFAPIMNMFTAAMSIKDMNPNNVGAVIQSLSGGLTGVIRQMRYLVTEIVASLAGLSQADIEKVATAAPMMEALANILGALQQPAELFEDQMRKGFSTYTDYEWLNDTRHVEVDVEHKKGADKAAEAVNFMVTLLEKIKDPLKDLIVGLAQMEIPGNPKEIQKNMKTISSVMDAVASAMGALKTSNEAILSFTDGRSEGYAATFQQISGMLAVIEFELTRNGGVFDTMATITDGAIRKLGGLSDDKLKVLDNSIEVMRKVAGMMSALIPLGAMAPDVINAVGAIQSLQGVFTAQTIEPLIKIVDAVSAFDESVGKSLADMPDIQALVGKVGDKLRVTNKDNITIERENLSINMKFSVHIDSKALVEQLVEVDALKATAKGTAFDENTNAVNAIQ